MTKKPTGPGRPSSATGIFNTPGELAEAINRLVNIEGVSLADAAREVGVPRSTTNHIAKSFDKARRSKPSDQDPPQGRVLDKVWYIPEHPEVCTTVPHVLGQPTQWSK